MPTDYAAHSFSAAPKDEPEPLIFGDTPVYAQKTRRSRAGAAGGRKIPLAALIATPVALIAVGAAAFYMSQPRETLMSEAAIPPEAPVAAAPAPATALPVAPVASDVTAPTTTTPPAPMMAPTPEPRRMAAAETPRRSAARPRTAPAAAPSADEATSDASATVPAGPVPYSSLNRTTETTPAPAAPTTTPAAPAPVNPAPAVTPPEASTPAPDASASEPIAIPAP